MKPIIIAIITIGCLLLSSCTLSSKNKHYRLTEHKNKQFYKEDIKWCFESSMNKNLTFCSAQYESYSTSFGFLLPIIPIKNRNSPLAFDIKSTRLIEISNQSTEDEFIISHLEGLQLCDNIIQQSCKKVAALVLKPNRTIILKLPEQEEMKILFEVNGHIFYEKLEVFTDKHWSLVL
ncbi:MAG: hypothetical protein HRU38_19320 [Saccharospirillaceae bacterium]|nr:hypothetical protein [Saccharospirillaceae bacterium]